MTEEKLIVKPLAPELLIERDGNAEMRWEAMAEGGYVTFSLADS